MEQKSVLNLPSAIIIAGVIIAGAILIVNFKKPATTNNNATTEEKIDLPPVTANDHIIGNPNADVVVIEYSDTECPFCKSFHTTMNRIVDEYAKDGKVAWVYRHFPIPQLHPKAQKEAEATECAAEMGGETMFWSYINALYEKTPSNNQLDPVELINIAKEKGLDEAQFKLCLDSGKTSKKVTDQYNGGVQAGVGATPTSFFVTKSGEIVPMAGGYPYATVKKSIDDLLAL